MHTRLSSPDLACYVAVRSLYGRGPQARGACVTLGEGLLAAGGTLVVRNGQYAGRSLDDKFVMRGLPSQDRIWWGPTNRPFDPVRFGRLSWEDEHQIWSAIHFGAFLKSVSINPATPLLDFRDDALTENTRAAHPGMFIPNAVIPGVAGHPSHIFS